MLDGELVIRDAEGRLEFDALQQRIHPAESRIALLSREIPADYVAFDLLAEDDEALLETPFGERRARLEALAERSGVETSELSPDPARAEEWLRRTEGTMAKQLDAVYLPGKRTGMAKVKREREIDCVVLGWRPGKEEGTVGSLILGLYDGERAAAGRPHLRLQGGGKTGAAEAAGAAGDGRERDGGAEPLDRRARARVGGAAARAGDRSGLRPCGGGTDPARGAVPAVQGRQRPAGVHVRAVGRRVSGA